MSKHIKRPTEEHKTLVVVLSSVAATLGDIVDGFESYQAARAEAPDQFVENQLSDIRHARERLFTLIEHFAHP
jgi:hypothetical protein